MDQLAEAARARLTIRILALVAVALWGAFYALPMPARLLVVPGLLSHLSIAARAARMEQGARDAARIQLVALVFAAGAAGLAVVFVTLLLGLGGGGGGSGADPRHALFTVLSVVIAAVELGLAHSAKRLAVHLS